jgi:hypothetical protein
MHRSSTSALNAFQQLAIYPSLSGRWHHLLELNDHRHRANTDKYKDCVYNLRLDSAINQPLSSIRSYNGPPKEKTETIHNGEPSRS